MRAALVCLHHATKGVGFKYVWECIQTPDIYLNLALLWVGVSTYYEYDIDHIAAKSCWHRRAEGLR
jgi:hypothetical protein